MEALDNKRKISDRRAKKGPSLKYVILGGRRKQARRDEDRNKFIITDQYEPRLLILIAAALTLSLVDGFYTLYLVELGAAELNPIMAYFLNLGPVPFIFCKFSLTSTSIICLLVLSNMYLRPLRIYLRTIFPALIVVFALAIAWQVLLDCLRNGS